MRHTQEVITEPEEEYEQMDDMPIIPEGEEGTPGDTLEDTDSIENELINTTWIEEAKQIPLDKVTPKEHDILTKFLNQEELTVIELDYLEQVLAQYRPAIQKHKPQEILANYESNKQYVRAEKTFLELLEEQEKETRELKINYPLTNGETIPLTLTVMKADSQIITDIQTNLGMFQDFTEQENTVKHKKEQGLPLTREEQLILAELQRKLREKTDESPIEIMVEFLAKTTRIKEEPESDYEYMKQVYSKMEFYLLEPIFDRVSKLSGIVTPNAEELFQ